MRKKKAVEEANAKYNKLLYYGIDGEYCKAYSNNIRIDTHKDNKVMQHVLARNGFKRCGIIFLLNGDPRVAFQLEVPSMDISEDFIANVMKHLDSETAGGSMRMSVNFDESQKEESIVSHKCCHAYGNPATDTIAKLDMYSDLYLKDMEESE